MTRSSLVSLVLGVGTAVSLASPSASLAQDVASTAEPGLGGNIAFTIVEARPPFFLSGQQAVEARDPEAFVRRASVSGEGDAQLIVASISDEDVLASHARLIEGMDRVDGVLNSFTWWGDVTRQRGPLTSTGAPTFGFVLGLYAGRDLSVREDQVLGAVTDLRRLEDSYLVAHVRGGADVLVMYPVDGANLEGGIEAAEAIYAVLGAHEIGVEVEGISTLATVQ